MSEPEEQRCVEVPANVYVECPLVGKRLRAVTACLPCEHYVGMNERFPDERMGFAVRFQVACRFPFARAIFEVVPEALSDAAVPGPRDINITLGGDSHSAEEVCELIAKINEQGGEQA